MNVRLSDSAREYALLKSEIDEAVLRVLSSGTYVQDTETASFEAEFAAFCSVDHAVATASGTVALLIGLKALGIGPGDEVITAPYTCVSTAAAITHAGARVVFADIEPDTLTLDPVRVAAELTGRTRAILPVHLHGQVANMDALSALAKAQGVAVLEDAALAVGALWDGRPAGSLGDAGAASFAPGKVLGGLGWGGVLTTNSEGTADLARQLAGYGPVEGAPCSCAMLNGLGAQMSGFVAAGLRVKLRHLDEWLGKRRAVASRYDEVCDRRGIRRLRPHSRSLPSYRVYIVLHPQREALLGELRMAGIQAGTHFVPPLHLRPLYAGLGYQRGDFPVAERAADELVCLPTHPLLSEDEISRVVQVLEKSG